MKEEATLEPQATPFNVVFCDDIRREVSGKEILIGVYSGDIIVPSVPNAIGVAMWIQIRTKGKGLLRTRVRVTDPAGNTAGEVTFDQTVGIGFPESETSETTTAITLPALPVSVIKPGVINVYWATRGDEYVLIGEKPVRIGGVASVPQPPAAQFPFVVPG